VFKPLIVAYGLFGFGYIVTATFIVAMARRLDSAALVEPLTWIVVGVLAAPSVLAWQRLAQHLGLFAALQLAYSIEAVGVLLAGFGSGAVAVIMGGALLGGTFMGITALGLIAARQVAGSNQDRAIGWMTASFGCGQVLGPAIAGRLAQMTQGFAAPSLVAALLLLVGIVLLRGERVKVQ
jgi:predicted MFS family arabinose efflux permease